MAQGTYKNVRGQAERRFIPDDYPPGKMDASTKQKLEDLRHRVLRYLFRAWSNSSANPSGGDVHLDTFNTITPLAFHLGVGHPNVYDLSRRSFLRMVEDHVDWRKENFCTEFSSWTASLLCAFNQALTELGDENEHIYISMIDTRALRDQNRIFFVPDLQFLIQEVEDSQMEYLVHGVVQGPFHCAVPIALFEKYDLFVQDLSEIEEEFTWHWDEITDKTIQNAALLGRHASPKFMFPMMLALLGTRRVPQNYFKPLSLELESVVSKLPRKLMKVDWINDSTIMHDIVFTSDDQVDRYPDVRQFTHLMRAVAVRQARTFGNSYSTLTNITALNIRDARKPNAAVTFNDSVEMMAFTRDYHSSNSSSEVEPNLTWEEHRATGAFHMRRSSVDDKLDQMGLETISEEEIERRKQLSSQEELDQQQEPSAKTADRKRKREVDSDDLSDALDKLEVSGRKKRACRKN